MIKVFCDNPKCGKEIGNTHNTATIILEQGAGVNRFEFDLCSECATEFKEILYKNAKYK